MTLCAVCFRAHSFGSWSVVGVAEVVEIDHAACFGAAEVVGEKAELNAFIPGAADTEILSQPDKLFSVQTVVKQRTGGRLHLQLQINDVALQRRPLVIAGLSGGADIGKRGEPGVFSS